MSAWDLLTYLRVRGGNANNAAASDTGDLSAQMNYLIARIKEAVGADDISPVASATGSLAERVAYLQANSTGAKKVQGTGYQVYPNQATGIDPATSSSFGAGSYSEVVPVSTLAAIYVLGFAATIEQVTTNNSPEFEIDIATGAAASEVVIARLPFAGISGLAGQNYAPSNMYILPFPLAVAANARIAVRARRSSTGGNVANFKLLYVLQSDLVAL